MRRTCTVAMIHAVPTPPALDNMERSNDYYATRCLVITNSMGTGALSGREDFSLQNDDEQIILYKVYILLIKILTLNIFFSFS